MAPARNTGTLDVTPQIVRVALAGTRDQIWQPLYTSKTFETGDSMIGSTIFFQDVGGKNIDESNLTQSSQLSANVSMLVRGHQMRAQFADDSGAALDDALLLPLLMQYSAITWMLTEKSYLKLPMYKVGGRLRKRGVDDFVQHFGDELAMPVVYDANVVEPIEPTQSFSVEWQVFGSPVTAENDLLDAGLTVIEYLRIYYYLLGYRRRPTQ